MCSKVLLYYNHRYYPIKRPSFVKRSKLLVISLVSLRLHHLSISWIYFALKLILRATFRQRNPVHAWSGGRPLINSRSLLLVVVLRRISSSRINGKLYADHDMRMLIDFLSQIKTENYPFCEQVETVCG